MNNKYLFINFAVAQITLLHCIKNKEKDILEGLVVKGGTLSSKTIYPVKPSNNIY